jgi:hypothetical protein
MEKQQRELYSSHTISRSHRMPVVLPGFLSSPIDGVVFVGSSFWSPLGNKDSSRSVKARVKLCMVIYFAAVHFFFLCRQSHSFFHEYTDFFSQVLQFLHTIPIVWYILILFSASVNMAHPCVP